MLRQRGVHTSYVTSIVSVFAFLAAFAYLPAFVMEAGLVTSYTTPWVFYLSMLLNMLFQILEFIALFLIATGLFVSNNGLSGTNRCRLIAISVLGGLSMVPLAGITGLSFGIHTSRYAVASRVMAERIGQWHINPYIVIGFLVTVLVWTGLSIGTGSTFFVFFGC